MRCLRCILLLPILVLLGTGCGNRTELNELGITAATGFDGGTGNWTITYQIINPSALSNSSGASGAGGSQSPVHTFSTQGKTIRAAVAVSNLENPRRLYFAHNNVVLIGKKTAEQGIDEIFDNYYRNPDARETVRVVIVEGEARDFLKKLNPPEKIPGQALSEILQKNTQFVSFYPSITMHELALKITSDSEAAGVPTLALRGEEDVKMNSTDIFNQTSTKGKVKVSGLSVFRKTKMIDVIHQKESLGISWLTNQIDLTTLSTLDSQSKQSAILIRKAKVKVSPILNKDNNFTLMVNAKVSGELLATLSKEDITSLYGLDKLQTQAEELIEAQMREGWKYVQRMNIDLIGIADKIHRKYPKEWKKIKKSWPGELANVNLQIHVDVNIKRVGLLQNSFVDLLKSE
ncbi:Spore germination protein B3 [Paenibacillus auburnensis]|uniref:Spore germination protein B3 n=1 Tax=Paenibacillus auburnensis TaxID=2905649 RepID=A0ABN8GJD9_9BACL|nr:Ger(x)C family spore germination protein [Paenibacillus auburnensis]CAH1204766.1 Spore germination protein B3 [Paenibacillus auburnensis]